MVKFEHVRTGALALTLGLVVAPAATVTLQAKTVAPVSTPAPAPATTKPGVTPANGCTFRRAIQVSDHCWEREDSCGHITYIGSGCGE